MPVPSEPVPRQQGASHGQQHESPGSVVRQHDGDYDTAQVVQRLCKRRWGFMRWRLLVCSTFGREDSG